MHFYRSLHLCHQRGKRQHRTARGDRERANCTDCITNKGAHTVTDKVTNKGAHMGADEFPHASTYHSITYAVTNEFPHASTHDGEHCAEQACYWIGFVLRRFLC